jgi:hypothetical protein
LLSLALTFAGNAEDFDAAAEANFRTSLAELLGVPVSSVLVQVRSGSIVLDVRVFMTLPPASSLLTAASLSGALGVSITNIVSTYTILEIQAPSPPPPSPPPSPPPPSPPPSPPPPSMPPTEMVRALALLYEATGGNAWRNNDKWLSGEPCVDGWLGVHCCPQALPILRGDDECTADGGGATGVRPTQGSAACHSGSATGTALDLATCVVVKVLLPSNNLIGQLDGALCGLPFLQHLDLSGNALTGSLPSAADCLPRLTYLDLTQMRSWDDEGGVTGPVPVWLLSRLGFLASLRLANNALDDPTTAESAVAISRLWQRCQTLGAEQCSGVPPIGCSAFNRQGQRYEVELDGLGCVRCPTPLEIFGIAGAVAGGVLLLLLLVGIYTYLVLKYPEYAKTHVATFMILWGHLQTLTIIGSLQLGWPLIIQEILKKINLPFMSYIPLPCILTDPVLKAVLSYAETALELLLLVGAWLVAWRQREVATRAALKRKEAQSALEEGTAVAPKAKAKVLVKALLRAVGRCRSVPQEVAADAAKDAAKAKAAADKADAAAAVADYFLCVLFSLLFTVGLRASVTLFMRYDENQSRLAIARFLASLLWFFWFFLFWRFHWLLREARGTARAAAVAKRIGMGKDVIVNSRRGRITTDDGTNNRYRVTFDDNKEVSGWLYPHDVTRAADAAKVARAKAVPLQKQARRAAEAVRYLTERYASDDGLSHGDFLLWAEKQIDGPIRERLEDGTIRLLRCAWLLSSEDSDQYLGRDASGKKVIMLRRQELPKEAFVTNEEAVALFDGADRSILALSYRWLTAAHPDPHGTALSAVRRFLRSKDVLGKCGMFWDFASLPQKPRKKEEEDTFKRGLVGMNYFYASLCGTAIVQLKDIPSRPSEYDGRMIVFDDKYSWMTSEKDVKADLERFGGKITEIAIKAGEAQVTFATHEQAFNCIAALKKVNRGADTVYNETAYSRGDGRMIVFDDKYSEMTSEKDVKADLERFGGKITEIAIKAGEAQVTFATHEQAINCIAALRKVGRGADIEPFSGWCTFEQGSSKLAAAHLNKAAHQAKERSAVLPERLLRADASRTKVIDISNEKVRTVVVKESPDALLKQTNDDLGIAKFVGGKADAEMVNQRFAELELSMNMAMELATADHDGKEQLACAQWPLRSQWQLVVWTRQGLLFLLSFAMDCVLWFSPYEAHLAARYVFATLAIAVLGGFCWLHCQRQPYVMRQQQSLETGLYAVDISAILLACLYGALTKDGAVQDGLMRWALELALGVLLGASVLGAALVVVSNIALERRFIQEYYLKHGLVQVSEGTKEAAQIIEKPVVDALRDGAVRLIDCAWLLDSKRSDGQLPCVTKVVAHLASDAPTSGLIRWLATHCGTSSICITVEATPPPSPPPSPPEAAALELENLSSAGKKPTLVATFHLSTFDEVAPLTAAGLRRKAEAVRDKLVQLHALEKVEFVKGKPFLPRCQDMPEEAFLSHERAAALFTERRRRGVRVGSYCWRMPGMPDPDGRTLEKMRGYLDMKRGGTDEYYGLFVDVACLPQNYAWPSWHAPEAVGRFGAEVSEGPLTVLKFEGERVATEDEAQVCVDKLVALCKEHNWALASIADFESLGLRSRDIVSVLFHGRYISGVYRFDEGADAEGYMRFSTPGDADTARQDPKLKRLCGGKEPKLMGEHVFENELKFHRGLSVMGSLYASATGTCVLQLTDPPDKLGKEVAPDELVSARTGTVFVVRTNMSLEELREELGDDLLACEKKGRGEVVVRVLGERAARAVRKLNERGYPLRTSAATRFVSRITCGTRSLRLEDRVVYPMYNLRPYDSRGWPTFETSAASIVLAHLTQLKRRPKEALSAKLKQLLESLEESGPKLMNIDVIGAPDEVVVAQSPEHFLRHCKKKLRSKKIFFTGKADQKVVVQLLSDFEGSITVQFDQKRAEHLKLRTEDLEDALTADMREARRKRARKKLQRLTVQEEPMRVLHVSEPTHTIHAVLEAAVATKYPELKPTVGTPTRILCATESHWVDPQKLPAPKPTVATEAPNPESTHEQRHATRSSVFVKWSNGEETLAYVKEYDIEKALYTVELERLGSGKENICEGKHLREANMFEQVKMNIIHFQRALHASTLKPL